MLDVVACVYLYQHTSDSITPLHSTHSTPLHSLHPTHSTPLTPPLTPLTPLHSLHSTHSTPLTPPHTPLTPPLTPLTPLHSLHHSLHSIHSQTVVASSTSGAATSHRLLLNLILESDMKTEDCSFLLCCLCVCT